MQLLKLPGVHVKNYLVINIEKIIKKDRLAFGHFSIMSKKVLNNPQAILSYISRQIFNKIQCLNSFSLIQPDLPFLIDRCPADTPEYSRNRNPSTV